LLVSSSTGYQIVKNGFQISKHARACKHLCPEFTFSGGGRKLRTKLYTTINSLSANHAYLSGRSVAYNAKQIFGLEVVIKLMLFWS